MSLFNANVSSGGIPIPHYTGMTAQKLGRVLRTSASNLAGSEATATQYNIGILPFLFAVDNSRFAAFHQNSSQHPTVWGMEVGAASFTLGSASTIQAVACDIPAMKQSPSNPLQFVELTGNEYVTLSTMAASGTGFTHSSHNLAASVTTPLFNAGACDVVWSTDGTKVVAVYKNSSTNKMNFSLYTVSGTTLTYVGTAASSSNVNTLVQLAAELTGGANNEAVISAPCSATNGFLYRITFDSSAVTIAMQNVEASAVLSTTYYPTIVGEIHTYAYNPPTTQQMIFDGAGSGAVALLSITYAQTEQLRRNSRAPFGTAMNWDVLKVGGNSMYPSISGYGNSPTGRSTLDTLSSEDARGFCASHDLSKAVSIHKNSGSGTFTYRGYNCPTS